MIRIISGIYKNRRLKKVPGLTVRPIQDKVKGALFNILGERLRGSVCLDGFAGTGSIGLEALSRGASRVVFVDEFYPAVKVIKSNIAKCGAEEKALVLHREFNRAVIDLAKKKASFDVIFLDPPYRLLSERNPLKVIRKRGILNPEGIIILRHHFKIKPKGDDFELRRRTAVGDDILAFFGYCDEGADDSDSERDDSEVGVGESPNQADEAAPNSTGTGG
jgi:16S rRNA (guanine(966)-N(2))-methyltransferase RsmD